MGMSSYIGAPEDERGYWDDKEPEEDDEPSKVRCSYPRCERVTTFDPTYGDLCYEHIRADNE
jgi:hypothetical protein